MRLTVAVVVEVVAWTQNFQYPAHMTDGLPNKVLERIVATRRPIKTGVRSVIDNGLNYIDGIPPEMPATVCQPDSPPASDRPRISVRQSLIFGGFYGQSGILCRFVYFFP
jgi:hypothetical protein